MVYANMGPLNFLCKTWKMSLFRSFFKKSKVTFTDILGYLTFK